MQCPSFIIFKEVERSQHQSTFFFLKKRGKTWDVHKLSRVSPSLRRGRSQAGAAWQGCCRMAASQQTTSIKKRLEAFSFFLFLSLDLNYKANGWTHTNTAYKSSHSFWNRPFRWKLKRCEPSGGRSIQVIWLKAQCVRILVENIKK